MRFIGECDQCDWATDALDTAVLAGLDSYPHEKETDFDHNVTVRRTT